MKSTMKYVQWQVHSSVEQLRTQLALADVQERSAADAANPAPAHSGTKMLYFSW